MSYRRVYFVRPVGHAGPIKIGCSVHVDRRVYEMSNWSPIPLEIVASVPGSPFDEHSLHRQFAAERMHGEWFRASDRLLRFIAGLSDDAFAPKPKPAAGRTEAA